MYLYFEKIHTWDLIQGRKRSCDVANELHEPTHACVWATNPVKENYKVVKTMSLSNRELEYLKKIKNLLIIFDNSENTIDQIQHPYDK